MSDFKFGAKLKLFGEYDINIEPNPEHPGVIEYRNENGIAIKKTFLVKELKITDPDILKVIPDETKLTTLVYNKHTGQLELGIVINPGEDFVLNNYKSIIEVDQVSLYYEYIPDNNTEKADS